VIVVASSFLACLQRLRMARGSVAEPCLIGLRSGTARRAHVGALPRPSEFE
jgi:hypothetical protein